MTTVVVLKQDRNRNMLVRQAMAAARRESKDPGALLAMLNGIELSGELDRFIQIALDMYQVAGTFHVFLITTLESAIKEDCTDDHQATSVSADTDE